MRSLLPFVPARVKSALVGWVCRLPVEAWMPPLYWDTLWMLRSSEWWSEERVEEYQVERLRGILLHCAEHVPYYRKLFRKLGFDASAVRRVSDLRELPFLDKETVRRNTRELLADNVPGWRRTYFTTGGTTGKPMGLYDSCDAKWRERAFIEHLWSRVNFRTGDRRAILRGAVVKSSRNWSYDAKERALVFSNFHMTLGNAAEYARVMSDSGTHFLHAYPSAAIDFAHLLRQQGVPLPRFRALLLGSENIYAGQRELLESAYGCRVYSWYGHSESLILAGECEGSEYYHIEPEYGLAEVINEDGNAATEGETGELVGTTLQNYVMPLIRYRTSDFATAGGRRCACGRTQQLIRDTRGRWLQEMLVGREENLISITALNLHSEVFDNVEQFQFYQRERGTVVLRVVRGPDYGERDTAAILRALGKKVGNSVVLRIEFVDKIELTAQGKFRFVVQELAIPEFPSLKI